MKKEIIKGFTWLRIDESTFEEEEVDGISIDFLLRGFSGSIFKRDFKRENLDRF